MLQDQVLVVLADSSNFIACIKLDVPVSARNKILKCRFEYFLGTRLYWGQLIRRQIILIRSLLSAELELTQIPLRAIVAYQVSS